MGAGNHSVSSVTDNILTFEEEEKKKNERVKEERVWHVLKRGGRKTHRKGGFNRCHTYLVGLEGLEHVINGWRFHSHIEAEVISRGSTNSKKVRVKETVRLEVRPKYQRNQKGEREKERKKIEEEEERKKKTREQSVKLTKATGSVWPPKTTSTTDYGSQKIHTATMFVPFKPTWSLFVWVTRTWAAVEGRSLSKGVDQSVLFTLWHVPRPVSHR